MTACPARARRPSLLLAMITITAVLAADRARAQDFPNRPIRLIVGPSPDTLNAAMKLASYDLVKEFEPVSIIGLISYALVVHPSVPARSVAELVALAKARPGALNCASAGNGTVPHLACETLNKSAGVNVVHVPYRDVNAAMMGTVGGTVQMFVAVSTVARAQILSGTVRGLAVTTAQRSMLLPDLPTMVESGYPDFVMPGWAVFSRPPIRQKKSSRSSTAR